MSCVRSRCTMINIFRHANFLIITCVAWSLLKSPNCWKSLRKSASLGDTESPFRFWKDKLMKPTKNVLEKSETEAMIDFVDFKPWRSAKVKNLKVQYQPWKGSYVERTRNSSDDTIYLYGTPRFFPDSEATRANELWTWPFLWTKAKVERLSWIMKQFQADVTQLPARELIELGKPSYAIFFLHCL